MDHVYTNNITRISDIRPIETPVGDHVLITVCMSNEEKVRPLISYRRDWSKYTREELVNELSRIDFGYEIEDVQANWNKLESILLDIINKI